MKMVQLSVLVVVLFFPDYETPEKVKEQVEDNTFLSSYTGDYADLTDRGISKTAKVFGVRCATNNSGDVKEHIYPFYNGDEIVGTKTRYVADKRFSFSGTFDNTGLFGEQLFRNKIKGG